MINKKQLCDFLVKAKRSTYASEETAQKIIEKDQSTTLFFKEGNLEYRDNYFGGEPFGGREVVFLKKKPIYIMTYYGLIDESVSDLRPVYKFLQTALRLIPKDYPFRGPRKYIKDDLIYKNVFTGKIDDFFGQETISSANGKELYRARYAGGFVCQRT